MQQAFVMKPWNTDAYFLKCPIQANKIWLKDWGDRKRRNFKNTLQSTGQRLKEGKFEKRKLAFFQDFFRALSTIYLLLNDHHACICHEALGHSRAVGHDPLGEPEPGHSPLRKWLWSMVANGGCDRELEVDHDWIKEPFWAAEGPGKEAESLPTCCQHCPPPQGTLQNPLVAALLWLLQCCRHSLSQQILIRGIKLVIWGKKCCRDNLVAQIFWELCLLSRFIMLNC